MKYSIVIPTYNHCDDLLKPCVEGILNYTNMSEVELIISANGCVDNTKEYLENLRQSFDNLGFSDHLKTVWHDEPLGYSRATNEGIKVSTGEYVILLNNDAFLLQQDRHRWIRQLTEPFNTNPNCGISCLIKGPSEPAGQYFAVFFLVMIHRRVFDRIGLLNEEYGVGGGEDTEFSIEAERAGFEVLECVPKDWSGNANLYTGDFPIWHQGEGTVHDPNLVPNWGDIFLENSLKLAKKYNPEWYHRKLASLRPSISVEDIIKEKLLFLQDQHPNYMYRDIIKNNTYEINQEKMQNRVVVDIGANIGSFSLFAAMLSARQVISVEPISSTYNQFLENIHQINLPNITTHKKLVAQEKGKFIKVALCEDSGHNSMYKPILNEYEVVETTTLNELIKDIDSDKIFLKLDCEGAEYDIIMSASFDDMRKVNEIAMEVHTDAHSIFKGIDIINNKLIELGFVCQKSNQTQSWQVDSQGNKFNYQEIPLCYQHWVRP